MITKFEKRVIAGMMAVLLCFSTLLFPVLNVNAQELEEVVEAEALEAEMVEPEAEAVTQEETVSEAKDTVAEEKKVTAEIVEQSQKEVKEVEAIQAEESVEEPTEIFAGTKNSTIISDDGQRVHYIFKPEKTGTYCIYIRNRGSYYFYLNESDFGDGVGVENYGYEQYFEAKAGELCEIEISCYDEAEIGTVMWGIEEVKETTLGKHEAVISEETHPIACYKFTAEKSGTYCIETKGESRCYVEFSDHQSGGQGPYGVQAYANLVTGEECKILISNYEDGNLEPGAISWSITEKEIPLLQEGEKKEEEADPNGEYLLYKFVPKETGEYGVCSTGYIYMTVYDSEWNVVNNFGEGEKIALDAGKTYYMEFFNDENITWSVGKFERSVIKEGETYSRKEGKPIEYQFTPSETGRYLFKFDKEVYFEIYDESEGYANYIYGNLGKEELEKDKTYLLSFDSYDAVEWSVEKAEIQKIQADTEYKTSVDNLPDYQFVPEKTGTFLLQLDRVGIAYSVYDQNWENVYCYYMSNGMRFSLTAGELYYIVVEPREGQVTWKIEMAEESGDYCYKVKTDGTVGIVCYQGNQAVVTIPQKIDGKKVTSIGDGAFAGGMEGNLVLEEVSIPASVKEILTGAFTECKVLKKVELASDSQLEIIGNGAFHSCEKLTSFVIPNSVKKIGVYTFGNTGLLEIDIPNNVTEVGGGAFAGCKSLQKVSIGTGLKKISDGMFTSCKNLTQVDFEKNGPSNVTKIEYNTFIWCENLQNIKFPESVKAIGSKAMDFTAWHNSQSDGVLYLDENLYGYKGKMPENTDVVVKDGTEIITDRAFESKKGLKSVELPDTVTNVGKFAFYNCELMKTVTIPKSVTEIAKCAFGYVEGNKYTGEQYYEDAFFTYIKKMEDFTIQGYTGTAAEKYAEDNGFKFVSLGTIKPEIEFKDVAKTDWFYDAATYVAENQIMTGLTKDTFGPDVTLTRAQFATILYRVNGEPAIDYNKKFSDIADGQWYTKGVLWANSIGVVNGYAGGLFGPEDNITREQMALMMYRYAKHEGYDISKTADISSFDDASKVSDYAKEAFEWAVGSEIISGKAGNLLAPQGKATRAECATIMMRFMGKYTK